MKIALCFLTYGNLSQPGLWKEFIDNTLYSVYIHNKFEFTDTQYGFDKYCLKNRIQTKWGKISLVKASLLLFDKAFNDLDNKFFILLSDKCIPIKSFSYIYNDIFTKQLSQISCFNQNIERKYNNIDPMYFNEYYKQSQWCLFNRNDIEFLLKNDISDTVFGNNSLCPDEHYFINIFKKYNRSFINSYITHSKWKEGSCLTYKTLSMNDIPKNSYFLRKIDSSCILPQELYDLIKFSNSNKDPTSSLTMYQAPN